MNKDIASWKKSKLVAAARERSLSVSGKKADLRTRLQDYAVRTGDEVTLPVLQGEESATDGTGGPDEHTNTGSGPDEAELQRRIRILELRREEQTLKTEIRQINLSNRNLQQPETVWKICWLILATSLPPSLHT